MATWTDPGEFLPTINPNIAFIQTSTSAAIGAAGRSWGGPIFRILVVQTDDELQAIIDANTPHYQVWGG